MRWLIGIGSMLMALGLIIAICAGVMDVTAATQVPDTSYNYALITKTISVVSIDLVRVQILWFVAGAAIILLGALLAATGYLGLRLGLNPAAVPTPKIVPVSVSAAQPPPSPPPPPTPEQIAEADAMERRETKLFLVCGLIAVIVVIILAVSASKFDQSDVKDSGKTNTAMDAADNMSDAETNSGVPTTRDAERAVTAKPPPSKAQPNDDDSGDVDDLETPAQGATSPATDPSSNST